MLKGKWPEGIGEKRKREKEKNFSREVLGKTKFFFCRAGGDARTIKKIASSFSDGGQQEPAFSSSLLRGRRH